MIRSAVSFQPAFEHDNVELRHCIAAVVRVGWDTARAASSLRVVFLPSLAKWSPRRLALCVGASPLTNPCYFTVIRLFASKDFELPYDYLVVSVGATTNTFNTPGVREHCIFLKQVQDAQKLRKVGH